MGRRNNSRADFTIDDVLAVLVLAPVWVGPMLAIMGFLVLNFIWPILFRGEGESPVASFGPVLAPYWGLAVGAAWFFAELQKFGRRRLLDTQTGLESIREISWQEFEHLVGEAYRRQGYTIEETGGSGSDGGVDLVLRGRGETVLVQCKQWRARSVGVTTVRELYGVLAAEAADRAILATCGGFTRDAKSFALGKPIQLVAGNELVELVHSAQRSRPKTKATQLSPTKTSPATKMCPVCNSSMILRTAKRGANKGKLFWGCSSYPACKATAPYE